jgi:DNA polymerase-4
MLAEVAEVLVRAALADRPQEKTISLLAISVSSLEEYPVPDDFRQLAEKNL